MSTAAIIRTARSAGIATAAVVMFCTPVVALAQNSLPPRAVQAPARQKPAPQPTATQARSAPTPTTQGLAPSNASGGNDVVARVDGINVSAEEVRGYIASLGAREQEALAKDPALVSQAVRLLLANRLVLKEVEAKKWDKQPTVAAQLDRVRESALVELYLQSASTPPANFPSEEDLQKVYDANRSAMLVPRQFELAQIFVAAPKDADKAAEEKAKQSLDDIQRKLKAPGADFAAIAVADNGEKDGGNLGWVAENQIRPEIRTQVMGLAKNGVSDPIRLDDGWHIIKLTDTKAAFTRTLAEVHDQLSQQIRAERATMLRRTYLTELLKEHPPILNELALSGLFDNSRK